VMGQKAGRFTRYGQSASGSDQDTGSAQIVVMAEESKTAAPSAQLSWVRLPARSSPD
jgi:hypothetical protein